MGTKSILAISLIAVLVIGAVSFDDAFAKEPKEDKPPKEPKTLESECAKKKPNSFDGLLCEAVFGLQQAFDAAVGGFQGQIDDLVDGLADHVNADNDFDSSNELQILSESEGTLTLSNGGSSVSCIDITGGAGLCDGVDDVDDADNDSTNELQNWSNLPGIPAGFSDGVDNVNDADSSTTNEIQNLSVAGQILSISGGNTVTLPTAIITQVEGTEKTIPILTIDILLANCPLGSVVIGGGFKSPNASMEILDSRPASATAWKIKVFNAAPTPSPVTAYAICIAS